MDIQSAPTYLGKIASVSGAVIHVRLAETVASGLAIIEGKTYKIGQVGSFIRIPQGYQNLYGIISDIGADAIPDNLIDEHAVKKEKWIKAQLVGEAIGQHFERGISQYPNVGDLAHLVTESDLRLIYSNEASSQLTLGFLSNAETIPAKIDLDKLVTRHSAVLGSTGSGKSTTVSSLIRTIASGNKPNARIVLLDLHGEYASALQDVAKIYSTETIPNITTHSLAIPYWALNSALLIKTLFGSFSDMILPRIIEKITDYKMNAMPAEGYAGITRETITVDTPIPFSIKQLWYDLTDNEEKTFTDSAQTTPDLISAGSADDVIMPRYRPAGLGNSAPFLNKSAMSIKRQLHFCRTRLKDHRYDFLLRPDDWEPSLSGQVAKDLDKLIEEWIGHDKPITILDLSTVPSEILNDVIGTVLNILYEAVYWGRQLNAGGRNRPLLIVMEEAHKYLDQETNNEALRMTKKIAKEGRKYGVGCMIVSQRPSEVNETILSQCGTFFALRLSNSADRNRVKSTLSDSLAGLLDMLPALRTGEAIITGEAANLPIRCRIHLPAADKRPNSFDPQVSEQWSNERQSEEYPLLIAKWRAQNSNFMPASNDNQEEIEDGNDCGTVP